jgi:hypothetical protein
MPTYWSYSQTLRAIGQSLEELGVQDFQLWPKDENFIVRYTARGPVRRPWWKRVLRRPPEQEERSIEVHYTPKNILWLQIEGEGMRKRADQIPNYYRMSQTLRTIGAYLDNMTLQFLALRQVGGTFFLEFLAWDGKVRVEQHGIGSFENYFLHTYMRGRKRSKP